MVSKYLEKKVEVISKNDIDTIADNSIHLEYYLVESDDEEGEEIDKSNKEGVTDGTAPERVYGIEIIKHCNGENYQKKLIKNLSHSKSHVRNILNKLIDNTVTPTDVMCILDELV